jgi:hypothetical protein
VATVALATQVAHGTIGAIFGLVALWMALWLLPGLFAARHGRAARHCRLAALGVVASAVIASGWALWT